eukprot:2458719-Pyramimonas_sp.AAC.1
MHGEGTLKTPQPDGTVKHTSLPSRAVWKDLRMVPPLLELRIRGLQWWQSVATSPQDNRQLFAALFGQFRSEEQPTILDHRLMMTEDGDYRGNPWASRVVGDLKSI